MSGMVIAVGVSAAEDKSPYKPEQKAHWAFQPIANLPVPKVKNSRWVKTPADAFILKELESHGIRPNPAADKITLIRRVTLDLTGLPPEPSEVQAFLADHSTKAFERVVDRLLASPRYGERWARHWLDLARFAESEGFKEDEVRPNAWRYRDYVIKSFNDDKPYDRFIREQIAGDELWPGNPEAMVATGFNRHYPDEHNARVLSQRRQEILNDITDTVGAVFSGLTFSCARCHNHKFDPILQTDYYRLQAFFANVAANDNMPLASKDEIAGHDRLQKEWEERTREIREEMEKIEAPKRKSIIDDLIEKYPAEIREAIATPDRERTPFQCLMAAKARQYLDPASHQYAAKSASIGGQLKGEEKKRWDALKTELDKFKDLKPADLPLGTGMQDLSASAPPTHLLAKGVYDKPREEVQPGFIQLLNPEAARVAATPDGHSTGRRTALAEILTSPANPLTARVLVNRLWHYHFGQGIAATPSDFGLRGERPTNPALLDWMAREFIKSGWSVKAMHKVILLSNTYQQSSALNSESAKLDPDDRLFWRFPRHRLEGEVIRDAALSVSGMLNLKMGGPSVWPELPPGMASRGGWRTTTDEKERNRRSVYVFVKRNTRYPMFETFDMPDTHESCSRRNVTTSPLQALTLLNSDLTLQWAAGFAGRVMDAAGQKPEAQVEKAFSLAFSRPPTRDERQMALGFLEHQRSIISSRIANSEPIVHPPGEMAPKNPVQAAALTDLCQMLINANEFSYLN